MSPDSVVGEKKMRKGKVYLAIVRAPLSRPARLALDPLVDFQDGFVLAGVAHMLARDPERLRTVGPAPMMRVGDGDGADVAGVPEHRVRFPGKLHVRGFIFEHE
ncbi:hypothetical protein KC338_g21 [Hortaea werneckii]|nr:hypothetical protein KC338_g21 [Hortaea werneckii]